MIFKNKIPATSVRQKPFSKLCHVILIKWLSKDHVWFEDRWIVAFLCDE
jgi:hypothetical protein